MKLESVEYTCPLCGTKWTEMEDPNDEWFKLGTHQTLCAKCGQEAIRWIKGEWNNENLSSWPRSH